MVYAYKKTGFFLYSLLALITVIYFVMSTWLFSNILTPNLLPLLAILSVLTPIMMLSCIAFDWHFTHRKSYLSYIKLAAIFLFSGGYLPIPILFMGSMHIATFLSTAMIVIGSSGSLLSSIVCVSFSVTPYFLGYNKSTIVEVLFSLAAMILLAYFAVKGMWLLLFLGSISQFAFIFFFSIANSKDDIFPAFIHFSDLGVALPPPISPSASPSASPGPPPISSPDPYNDEVTEFTAGINVLSDRCDQLMMTFPPTKPPSPSPGPPNDEMDAFIQGMNTHFNKEEKRDDDTPLYKARNHINA